MRIIQCPLSSPPHWFPVEMPSYAISAHCLSRSPTTRPQQDDPIPRVDKWICVSLEVPTKNQQFTLAGFFGPHIWCLWTTCLVDSYFLPIGWGDIFFSWEAQMGPVFAQEVQRPSRGNQNMVPPDQPRAVLQSLKCPRQARAALGIDTLASFAYAAERTINALLVN